MNNQTQETIKDLSTRHLLACADLNIHVGYDGGEEVHLDITPKWEKMFIEEISLTSFEGQEMNVPATKIKDEGNHVHFKVVLPCKVSKNAKWNYSFTLQLDTLKGMKTVNFVDAPIVKLEEVASYASPEVNLFERAGLRKDNTYIDEVISSLAEDEDVLVDGIFNHGIAALRLNDHPSLAWLDRCNNVEIGMSISGKSIPSLGDDYGVAYSTTNGRKFYHVDVVELDRAASPKIVLTVVNKDTGMACCISVAVNIEMKSVVFSKDNFTCGTIKAA